MKEDELKAAVLDLCRLLHVRSAHFRPAKTAKGYRTPVEGDGKGYPDLTLVGQWGVLFRELKQDGKYPTKEQREWLDALHAAGANAAVWRPADLHSGRIKAELLACAGKRVTP